jgi:hypothetical protein
MEEKFGIVAASEKVYAEYITASGQSIPPSSYTIVDYNSKLEDSHNAVTTGASWKFTAPRAGIYQLNLLNLFDLKAWTAGEYITALIHKNGSSYKYIQDFGILSSSATYYQVRGSAGIKLNAGDYIDIRFWHNSATASALIATSTLNWITISSL